VVCSTISFIDAERQGKKSATIKGFLPALLSRRARRKRGKGQAARATLYFVSQIFSYHLSGKKKVAIVR